MSAVHLLQRPAGTLRTIDDHDRGTYWCHMHADLARERGYLAALCLFQLQAGFDPELVTRIEHALDDAPRGVAEEADRRNQEQRPAERLPEDADEGAA